MLSTVYRALTLSSPDSSWAARPKTKQRAKAYFMVSRVSTCVASYKLKFTLGLGWVWCAGETTGVRRTGPCPVKTLGETGHGALSLHSGGHSGGTVHCGGPDVVQGGEDQLA